MPLIGEVKRAKEIGYKGSLWYRWSACSTCGKERWVRIRSHQPQQCSNCVLKTHHGEKAANWRGGRVLVTGGYIGIWVSKDDFFYPMATSTDYVKEHRLVMAKHLGRCLHRWEVVHHRNGVKDDNRLENLELTIAHNHSKDHSKGYRDGYTKGLLDGHETRIKQLEARVTLLEAENVMLKLDKFIDVV